ncbi:MAG: DUF2058 domain-containing protein [Thiohalobacteraceae bacterium]|nr:DUF2058 domain-containing protein [Gammaproteobacteria bacterium]
MANSFGDQFLKAGLVNKARLNEAQKAKSKQQKQKLKQKIETVDEAAVAARQAAAEAAERDRELNRRHQEEAERKAVQAQIRQLIELNRLPHDGEVGYNFQDGAAIRKIFVTEMIRDRLAGGVLAIVRYDEGYEVVPAVVADRILQRDPACIVSRATAQPQAEDAEDPYADYKVPDDLMW